MKSKIISKHSIFHYIFVVIYYLVKEIFESILWVILGVVGFLIFKSGYSPFHLIIGLPLALISLGMLVNNLWSYMLSIFSPTYNKEMCIFCNKPVEDRG